MKMYTYTMRDELFIERLYLFTLTWEHQRGVKTTNQSIYIYNARTNIYIYIYEKSLTAQERAAANKSINQSKSIARSICILTVRKINGS